MGHDDTDDGNGQVDDTKTILQQKFRYMNDNDDNGRYDKI